MKSYLFFSLFILFSFASAVKLSAQRRQIQAANDYLASGHYEKAKEAITLALENDKTKNSVEAWYVKALIYTQLSIDSVLSKQYQDAPEQALAAFDTARRLNEEEFKQYVLNRNAGEYLPLHIYVVYYQKGVNAFNQKDFLAANQYFLKARDVNDYLLTLPNSNRPLFDTSIVLNIALSADRVYNESPANYKSYQDTCIKYYEQLANMKLSRREYEHIYEYLVNYFYQVNPNEDKLKKYLFIGKQMFPESKFLKNVATDWKIKSVVNKNGTKQELFNAYEESINQAPDAATKKGLMQNYVSELFAYVNPTSGVRTNVKDYDERLERLESLFEELISDYPNDWDIHFDYAKHFINQFSFAKRDASPLKGRRNELLNQMAFNKRNQQKATGATRQKLQREALTLKSDLEKIDQEIASVKRQQDAIADKVLEHIQGIYNQLLAQHKKGALSMHEKNKFKSVLAIMLDVYEYKKDKEKAKELDALYDALSKN